MLRLFDLLPDVLFFIKDTQCRYTHVNQTLTQRLGIKRREDILGKSVLELYPPALSMKQRHRCRRCGGEIDAHAYHWHEQGRRARP